MKRYVSIFLTLILLTVTTMSFFSCATGEPPVVESDITLVEFNKGSFQSLSDEEIFKNKLKEMNVSEKYYDLLRRESFDKIVNSVSMYEVKSFYVEETNKKMKKVSETEYKSAVEVEKAKVASYIKSRSNFSKDVDFSSGNSATVNLGTLSVSIMLVTSEDNSCTAMSIFYWETMPSARHTDAIGISRGEHLGVTPQTAHGMVQFNYTLQTILGTQSYITESYYEEPFSYNDVKKSPSGYAIEFDLPKNTSESDGTWHQDLIYTDALGFVSYEGGVNDSSAIFVNHYLTYGHQRVSLLINSIDFSIAFPFGFSINGFLFGKTYDQLCDEHRWDL